MGSLRIAVGSDHGGFEQKEIIAKRLTAGGCEVTDFGCSSTESVDYPDYAAPVAQAVARGDADFGILVCGTGIGMMLAANKVKGIRAANVTSVEFAHLAREHNNANVLAMGGRVLGFGPAGEIVRAFVESSFEGGRHARRVNKIMAIEQQ